MNKKRFMKIALKNVAGGVGVLVGNLHAWPFEDNLLDPVCDIPVTRAMAREIRREVARLGFHKEVQCVD